MGQKVTTVENGIMEPAGVPASVNQTALEPAPVSQADRLLELAITSQADPAYLDKLLDMKMRVDGEQARKAYEAALADFKAEGIVIAKDKQVEFETRDGWTSYTHATLGNIVEVATPRLAAHGLNHRWNIDQSEGTITVTCILSHRDGHSEISRLSAGADSSGKKNAIQQVASTVSYLERYTFLAITGLATKDMIDNDGQTPVTTPVQLVGENEINTIDSMLKENELNEEIFMKWLAASIPGVTEISEIPLDQFAKVENQLKKSIKQKQAQK